MPTEKSIRAALAGERPQTRFGDKSIRALLSVIDEQRGTIAMHEANADELALTAARREARISELESDKHEDPFSELAHANAFDELKRRDEQLQAVKADVGVSRAYLPAMSLFCLSVVKNEDVGLRFGHTAAALQAEWRRMGEKIEALEREVKACCKGECE